MQRVIKEAVHELGHAFGLTHCENSKCVMHFSNSLQDTAGPLIVTNINGLRIVIEESKPGARYP